MNEDLNEAARQANRDYRAAEKARREGRDLPYLVTLNFANAAIAHELIDSIKRYGGVILEPNEPSAVTVGPCGVMDFREWGGETEIFGPKWPNHPDKPED